MKILGIFVSIFLSLGILSSTASADIANLWQTPVTHKEEKQTCPTYDLRDPVLGANFNQYNLPWCYAYAAADLLTNYTGKRVAPIPTAFSYIKEISFLGRYLRNLVTGNPTSVGLIATAIKNTVHEGLCLTENVRYADEVLAALIKSGNKNSILNKICTKPEEPFDLKVDQAVILHDDVNYRILSNILNKSFAKKRIVGIEYFASLLTTGVDVQVHVSTVVGQRYRNGQCENLIRNSWGNYCGENSFPCEEGNSWVPRRELQKYVLRVTTIN